MVPTWPDPPGITIFLARAISYILSLTTLNWASIADGFLTVSRPQAQHPPNGAFGQN